MNQAIAPQEITTEDALRAEITRMIKTIFDPEIPVDIYELGLIYAIEFTPAENNQHHADIRMTLTSPNCPSAAELPASVKRVTQTVEGIASANVDVVFDPPWTRAMMSEAAQLSLGFF
jgi:FeS assembly SUF system protein